MKIERFSGKWVPKEDRILLSIIGNDNLDYRLWITRLNVKKIFICSEKFFEKEKLVDQNLQQNKERNSQKNNQKKNLRLSLW